jgi:tRNA (guanine37-N1)-methyltransferase
MRIDIITPFPEVIHVVVNSSILRRSQMKNIVSIFAHDLRKWTQDEHQQIDDYPYGGGPGMILKPEPIFRAVDEVLETDKYNHPRIIFPTPDGKPFSHQIAIDLSKEPRLVFICGHYKGVDERVREALITDEISIGDYILTGGELPALVIMDAVIRLIPGVLNTYDSALTDSFINGLVDCPWYTRPEIFRGLKVPSVLLSGHHENIKKWRHEQRIKRTKDRRPDLYDKYIKQHKRNEDSGG